jgi:2,4-dienoyl-CoA reductase-like NADH-dependent reductase (Old Yellow Enzyme family)
MTPAVVEKKAPEVQRASVSMGFDLIGILRATLLADPELTERLAERFGIEPARSKPRQ